MNVGSKKNENIFLIFLIKFIRIKDATTWIAVSILGFILALSSMSISIYIEPFIVLLITYFCIISFTFSINNFYDIDTDKRNPRRKNINPIASGRISIKTSKILIITLAIIPLFISFLFGNIQLLLFAALLIFLGWSYSAPPLRVKGRPVADIIIHFFGFFLGVLYGSYIAGKIELISILVAISVGVSSCIYQVLNHILDYSYDKKGGTVTFAVWLGLDKAKLIMNLLIISHIIIIIPLIILYTLYYYVGFLILFGSIIISIFLSAPKKTFNLKKITLTKFIFYFTNFTYMNIAFNVLVSISGVSLI